MSPKEKFWEAYDNKVENMSLEKLQTYTKNLNRFAQNYFSNWMKAEEEAEELRIKLISYENN